MASVNPHTRELVFKLVFYGPGLGGKTTTLQYLHAATKPEYRGKMVSLATPTDRTLYFDFLPIRVPRVRGMAVRLQLFTVPGQVYYAATRKLVLSGADGVVFVADSQNGRTDVNQESLEDLRSNLAEHNRTLEEIPHTFHWNKRDLTELVAIEELDRRFNVHDAPSLGTVATKGEGVFEGLERITRLVLKAYEKDPKVRIEANEPRSDPDRQLRIEAEGVAHALRKMESLSADPIAHVSPIASAESHPSEASGNGVSLGASEVPVAKAVADGPLFTLPDAGTHARATPTDISATGGSTTFSLAELWPEGDRERVRQAEAMLAAHDAVNAILACDVLVTRVLASAAGLVGTLDAPRDPALVSLLLGLDGGRYLQFRTLVRAARHRETVTMKDALECFTFSIEARRAREALRR